MKLTFYYKPGCINNEKQKLILRRAGLDVIEKNMLEERWSVLELGKYFRGYLLSECFNESAPQVKSGEIVPGDMNYLAAMSKMIAFPVLIKRPLINIEDTHYMLGFNVDEIERLTGVNLGPVDDNIHLCARTKS